MSLLNWQVCISKIDSDNNLASGSGSNQISLSDIFVEIGKLDNNVFLRQFYNSNVQNQNINTNMRDIKL